MRTTQQFNITLPNEMAESVGPLPVCESACVVHIPVIRLPQNHYVPANRQLLSSHSRILASTTKARHARQER